MFNGYTPSFLSAQNLTPLLLGESCYGNTFETEGTILDFLFSPKKPKI